MQGRISRPYFQGLLNGTIKGNSIKYRYLPFGMRYIHLKNDFGKYRC